VKKILKCRYRNNYTIAVPLLSVAYYWTSFFKVAATSPIDIHTKLSVK